MNTIPPDENGNIIILQGKLFPLWNQVEKCWFVDMEEQVGDICAMKEESIKEASRCILGTLDNVAMNDVSADLCQWSKQSEETSEVLALEGHVKEEPVGHEHKSGDLMEKDKEVEAITSDQKWLFTTNSLATSINFFLIEYS